MEPLSPFITKPTYDDFLKTQAYNLTTTFYHPLVRQMVTMPTVRFFQDSYVIQTADIIHKTLFYAFICWLLGIAGIIYGFSHKSRKLEQKQLLKGHKIVSAKEYRRLLKSNASDLSLASCPLPKNSEMEHLLLSGTTGVGKTNCLHELLQQIRKRGNRAIIVDLRGNLTPVYYRPGKDILLNPFDQRSENWHVWAECQHSYEFDEMAEFLLPAPSHSSGDQQWWYNAGRTMFSVAAKKLQDQKRFSMHALRDYLVSMPLEEIREFFNDTDIASFTGKEAAKTAASVRSVLTPLIRKISYLKDSPQAFSLRDWITKDEGDAWVFLTAGPNQKKALLPLISAWIGWSFNSLKTLPEVRHPRLWLICDELPQLQYLSSLEEGLSEIRGFGGCFVAGIQDYHQLKDIYGSQKAHTLLSLFNTKVTFNCADKETASYMAAFYGEQEVKEHFEGLSFGANTVRDGVNLSEHKKIESILRASDLMTLPKLQAYLKTPGHYPPVHLHFNFNKVEAHEPRFVPRPEYRIPKETEVRFDDKDETQDVY